MDTSLLQEQLYHFLHQDNRVHYARSQSEEFSLSLTHEKHRRIKPTSTIK
uniref:Uncharacterized protein n=1 Tax=Arundo donax TaxID=35708 RepID=A0A0A8Z208_ARUDO